MPHSGSLKLFERVRTTARVMLVGGIMLIFGSTCLADEVAAYNYLTAVMDQFNVTFNVFTDLGAAGNHFAALCGMGNHSDIAGVSLDESWTTNCHSGATCVRNSFVPIDAAYWGGWYFDNGVLLGSAKQPECNWGQFPGAGFHLNGAGAVTFWARGQLGGERIDFFAGGIGRDAITGAPTSPHPDSFARTPPFGHTFKLTSEWRKYTINLDDRNLKYVVGGFAWVASAQQNPSGATFYLDDIQYKKRRPKALRFLVSYRTRPVPGDSFDYILQNFAFTYDNSATLLALLAQGTKDARSRARLLADAFVYAQQHDRFYTDGRLRNAYQGGDEILPPGWVPNGKAGTARLPGWWDTSLQEWVEDAGQAGTTTGNVAWAMMALLRAYKAFVHPKYLNSARALGGWIEETSRDGRGAGGYTGGFTGFEPNPTKLSYKATEHNIDAYVAFATLAALTSGSESQTWQGRSLHAKQFVRSMWQACGPGHFATGTLDDGSTPNCSFFPEDVNTWGLMALGEASTYGAGVSWVHANAQLSEACPKEPLTGLDFNTDRDGIWWEGTAHTAIADEIMGNTASATLLLQNLRQAQSLAPNANGAGIVATCHDGVTTGISNFLLYNRLHIAATAWYVLAELGENPFWGIHTTDPIPHQGE